jgi:hypothetical protein
MKRLTLLFLLFASPALAQVCPGFPVRGAQIIDTLAPRYPGGTLSGTDDQRRDLTRAIIEQMVYEMPADGWTWKSADPGRPPSKDSIARLVGGRLCNYDWQSGGTRLRQVQPGQPGDDITGQNPIPVAGVNHLADAPPVVVPPVVVPPYQPPVYTDLGPVYQRLDAMSAQAERMFADLTARDAARAAQIQAVDVRLEKHDTEPGWLKKVMTNSNTYVAVLGVLGGFLANGAAK